MLDILLKFNTFIRSNEVKFKKNAFTKVAQSFNFQLISENTSIDDNQKLIINKNMKNSKIIIIQQIKYQNKISNKKYQILAFEDTLIILENSSVLFLNNILLENSDTSVCFLCKNKSDINKQISFQNHQIYFDSKFEEEIRNFVVSFAPYGASQEINQFWNLIAPCISGYLIKKSYFKTYNYRIEKFIGNFDNDSTPTIFDENEYVELRIIGHGSLTFCILTYIIKSGKLCVIKKGNDYNIEAKKLKERETSNYKNFKHPFLPKYYGTTKNKNNIIIEYIDGKTLSEIDKGDLNYDDRIKIIFELMLIIEYFHDKNFIYRDLKPNNIMIDNNKMLVLIDLDRLVGIDDESSCTVDFTHEFIDPSINQTNKFSTKSDIYSLGKIFVYLMKGIEINSEALIGYSQIKKIFDKCTRKSITKRPPISYIIQKYNSILLNKVKIEYLNIKFKEHYINFQIIHNFLAIDDMSNKEAQTMLAYMYLKGIYVAMDTNKVIYYYTLAANQNYPIAQHHLGMIYRVKYIEFDIHKSIYYFSLAANQKYAPSQFNLGLIYYDSPYVECNINKAIYYFTLAANQQYPPAQYYLGLIYYDGLYVECNINKAIYYFTLAANQKYPEALFYLGLIYQVGQHIKRDISKAIYYYSLAANQNNMEAQFNLGYIYLEDQQVKRDISKAIYYYSLAANQNSVQAQYNLGVIYSETRYGNLDIKKAIYYYSLAANQNYANAQYNLGKIYYEAFYIRFDISKSMNYFLLAANQNYADAQFALGDIYWEGKYVKRDIEKSIYYYSLSANQNHLDSQFNLGIIYWDNQYVKRDVNKSIYYFSLAAKHNFIEAQFNLGVIYSCKELNSYNINKSIHYLSLAAKQNYAQAQFNLGYIYSEKKFGSYNISESIHYLTLAANQNHKMAQYYLGLIYYEFEYFQRDISKSIHYLTLAANQNDKNAQFYLGAIYYAFDINKSIHYFSLAANQNDKISQFNLGTIYLKQDINKAIHYFSLAANQNFPQALCILGSFYEEGKYVSCDINKAIHYYTLAANQNNSVAQYNLGLIYFLGQYVIKDIKKGSFYIMLSSKNHFRIGNFAYGFLLHEGKAVQKNIEEAIHYYKKASSFNIEFAKNNLGIIYKHGYGNVKSKIGNAIEYFKEAIRQKNDYLSMYNLAHIYIYDETINIDINKIIDLLIMSSNKFAYSSVLLSLFLIKQFGFNIEKIRNEIINHAGITDNFINKLLFNIKEIISQDKIVFEFLFESFKKEDFVYNIEFKPILLNSLEKENEIHLKYPNIKNITQEFYDGFGQDLLFYKKKNYDGFG